MIADAVVIIVLLACIFSGQKRGIAKMLLNIAGFGVSAVAAIMLQKPVNAFLESMQIPQGLALRLAENGSLDLLPGILLDTSAVSLSDNIYTALANTVVSTVSFLAAFLLVRLVLFFISAIMGIATSLPVIHRANGLLGGIAGFFTGTLLILIILAVIALWEAFGTGNAAEQIFDGSRLALLIYNNNPILSFFAR